MPVVESGGVDAVWGGWGAARVTLTSGGVMGSMTLIVVKSVVVARLSLAVRRKE